MVEQNKISDLFRKWVEENEGVRQTCSPTGFSMLYGNEIQALLAQAFAAGFSAKLEYTAEENLQK